MPTYCAIYFRNNPKKVFFTGQLLSGTVCLTVTSEETVRGVYVEVYGIGYVLWSATEYEEHNGKRKSVIKSYIGKECHLRERTQCLGDTGGNVSLIFLLNFLVLIRILKIFGIRASNFIVFY